MLCIEGSEKGKQIADRSQPTSPGNKGGQHYIERGKFDLDSLDYKFQATRRLKDSA